MLISDQRALCLRLEGFSTYPSRCFHYPQHWLNSFDIPETSSTHIQRLIHLLACREPEENITSIRVNGGRDGHSSIACPDKRSSRERTKFSTLRLTGYCQDQPTQLPAPPRQRLGGNQLSLSRLQLAMYPGASSIGLTQNSAIGLFLLVSCGSHVQIRTVGSST